MNPQPHQYPLYKPTTNFSSAFVPNVPVVEELISPFAEHTQAFPTRQGYSNPAIDITTMIYMSNIPPSLSTYSMEQILWACGPVRSFKRVVDYNGRNRRSGFCTFENSLALVRALRVLGGEGVADVPELKGGIKLIPGVDISCFRIAADPIARFSLRAVHDPTPAESDRITIDKIRVVLAGLTLSESDFRAPPKKQHVAKRAAPSQAPAEQLQLMTHISKEELALEEEQDRKRAEKRQQEQKAAFHDREQRWLAHEHVRLARIKNDMEFDREQDEKRQRARKNLGIYLAEFDDDYESSRCEFFYDRSRWLHKRDRDLKKEQDADNKDRNMDDDERQFAQSQEQESAARAEDRVAAAREQAEKEDVEEMVIDQPEGFIVTRIMTKEERIAAIQELVATIPATKEELWEWPVKWQFMDDVILSKKLGPFLSKKVIEIVGDEEKDLVDFILENIKSCADCQSIFDELEPVLDEETEVFVMKLWRMVIYETEARAAGL